jgi:hypothetical protein
MLDDLNTPLHIIPVNDFKEHEESEDCWCKPKPTSGVVNTYTHNSADGRELLEELVLLRAESYLHIARVAALWFSGVVTFFSYANDDTAVEWLNRRKEHIISLDGNSDWRLLSFKQYVENLMLGFDTSC